MAVVLAVMLAFHVFNTLVVGAVVWHRPTEKVVYIVTGIVLGQAVLLAIWCGFGRGTMMLRYPGIMVLVMWVNFLCLVDDRYSLRYAGSILGAGTIMIAAIVAPAVRLVRRWYRWCLMARNSTGEEVLHYSVRDLLGSMLLCGLVLVLGKSVISRIYPFVDEGSGIIDNYLQVSIWLALFVFAAWVTALLATRLAFVRWLKLPIALVAGAIICALLALAGACVLSLAMELSWQQRGLLCRTLYPIMSVIFLSEWLTVTGVLLLLRATGVRFARAS